MPLLFMFGTRIADPAGFVESNLGRLLILALDCVVHLAAVHRHLARGFDSQTNFVAAHVDDGHDDVIANDNALVTLPRKHKHGPLAVAFESGHSDQMNVPRIELIGPAV